MAAGNAGALRGAAERWLFGARAVETAPIHLGQRRIYVLPTAAGWVFALVLLVMLIASINYSLSLGYALTFLLGGVALASTVHAARNLLDLTIRPGRGEAVFCGEDAVFRLLIDNPRAARRPALALRAHGRETVFELAAGDGAEIALACPTARRGEFAIGRTVLETRWPLGLARAWSVFTPATTCLVYPAPEADPPPLPVDRAADGTRLRSGGEGDEDFSGLRRFRDADSLRHVAWKVVARGGPLLTKQFTGLVGADLLLDSAALPPSLDLEAKLSRLAAWLLAAERSGCRYALVLGGTTIAPGRGELHLHRCLRQLALFRNVPSGTRDA
ncbi:MAG: DUF58 domain-containing protein [Thauera phenolivorans]|uniref:DUF58 domain-containing protein n=2 Tax=Thauera phenolivorans TaxID=1792543 RepID=A0A7X7R8M0_9RHOO|nr:DUF58 domain-containing protein [Thauera phenolivorans]NLF55360.1 DUF58 domain-containing protein [Thauera phenolivorans]